jgi:hypothetical protein
MSQLTYRAPGQLFSAPSLHGGTLQGRVVLPQVAGPGSVPPVAVEKVLGDGAGNCGRLICSFLCTPCTLLVQKLRKWCKLCDTSDSRDIYESTLPISVLLEACVHLGGRPS